MDKSADVRRTLAHNSKIPRHLLDKFLSDPDEDVRKTARWRLGIED